MARRRLDAELVRRGLIGSRAEAQEAVRSGLVMVRGAPATKSTTLVSPDEPLVITGPGRPFVSRGGEKLAAALEAFSIEPTGRDCLDAGASTGGFTDCLLQRGAAHVVAVDIGHGQLAWELRTDPRVTLLEKTDVRDLEPAGLPFRPSIVTADLSFISLRLAVRPLASLAAPGGDLVLLVKPQFEARREQVERGGVVRDPAVWRRVIVDVADVCRHAGAGVRGVIPSPLKGPAGNVEFLLHARAGDEGTVLEMDRVIGAAEETEG